MDQSKGLGGFGRYLTVWVCLCIVVGVLIEVPLMLMTKGWFPQAE